MPTKISWTDETWNPVVGCTKCSPGCENCYAERLHNKRYKAKKEGKKLPGQYLLPFKFIQMFPKRLVIPFRWRKPRRVFVCSMGDLFHEKVPSAFIDRVRQIFLQCPLHNFQVLTKRIKRLHEYCEIKQRGTWPSNVHLGVSISTYLEMWKADVLEEIPAAIRYVSLEPLLEEVPLKIGKLDWVIIGCESGPKRRPCKLEWVQDIVKQCKAAGVPVFVKQLDIDGKVERDMKKFPKDLQIQEYPK